MEKVEESGKKGQMKESYKQYLNQGKKRGGKPRRWREVNVFVQEEEEEEKGRNASEPDSWWRWRPLQQQKMTIGAIGDI